jgi:heat shock protein HslJ
MRLAVATSVLVAALVAGCGESEEAGSVSLEGQPWVLIAGVELPQDVAVARPSAFFDGRTVSGSTGCNQYSASYSVDGASLEIGEAALTRMACSPQAEQIEQSFVAAFEQVTGLRFDGEELVLVDDDDTELLRFEAATPVGSWEATAFLRGDAVSSPISGTELTATFAADGAISGSGGCNRFTGSYETDGGDIDIGELAATRMACASPEGVMEQETAYLDALRSAVGFRADGNALTLLTAEDTIVASFARAR